MNKLGNIHCPDHMLFAVLSCSVVSALPFMDCSPPGSSVHVDSPGKNTGVGHHALLQGNLSNRGFKPRSPELQADALLSEPPGMPTDKQVSLHMIAS